MKISRLLAGTALAFSMATGAYAAPMDGSFGGALLDPTSTSALLAVGTTIGNAGALVTSTEAGSDFAGAGLTGQPVVMPDFVATGGGTEALSLNVAGFGAFAGVIQTASATGPASSRSMVVYALGTWTPEVPGAFDTFDASAASVTLTANQTGGAGSAISVSFTLAAPPAPPPVTDVPEPMSMALFGLGLAGLGVAMRRKA